jgi:Na+/melibiose symporter-like transporter
LQKGKGFLEAQGFSNQNNGRRRRIMISMAFNIFLAALLLFFMILGLNIPQMSNPADFVEARGFPVAFAIIGLILLAGIVRDDLKRKKKTVDAEELTDEIEPKHAYKILLVVALTVLYIQFVGTLGFFLMTLITVYFFINVVGSKKQGFNILFAVITVVLLTLFFGRFFGISLPRGRGILRDISFYLY